MQWNRPTSSLRCTYCCEAIINDLSTMNLPRCITVHDVIFAAEVPDWEAIIARQLSTKGLWIVGVVATFLSKASKRRSPQIEGDGVAGEVIEAIIITLCKPSWWLFDRVELCAEKGAESFVANHRRASEDIMGRKTSLSINDGLLREVPTLTLYSLESLYHRKSR